MVPMVDVVEALSVTHATAWEPHKLWMESGNGLSQVLAEPMPLEGLMGEEAHHIDRHMTFLERCQSQAHLSLHRFLIHYQRKGIAIPALALGLDFLLGIHLTILTDELYQHLVLFTILIAQVNRKVERLVSSCRDAIPPYII